MPEAARKGQVQLLKIAIRPGGTGRLVDYLRGLAERPEEVQRSLEAEGILAESLFLERSPTGDHLYFFSRARDLQRAARAFRASELPLDVETREVIGATWGEAVALEPVVDLVAAPEGEPRPEGSP
ncbi:MAG: DUF6176 family protein [Gemmatimonadota bacterium]|jgi:hypothetical protein